MKTDKNGCVLHHTAKDLDLMIQMWLHNFDANPTIASHIAEGADAIARRLKLLPELSERKVLLR